MHAHEPSTVTALPLPAAPTQGVATVTRAGPDGALELRGEQRSWLARRAASCLLVPQVGDTVWMVGQPGAGLFVIAVLERQGDAAATLAVPGDLEVHAHGQLRLRGERGVAVQTEQALALRAQGLQVQARTAHVALQQLTVLARSVFASLVEVTRVGKVLELLVDRVTQRSKHSVRAIEGIDHTEAQTVDIRAQGSAHIQATHALVNGSELVKMDGGQIHLG